MWQCKDNLTCIDDAIVCDGYFHCRDGSDEDEEMCRNCFRDFGYPSGKIGKVNIQAKKNLTFLEQT